MLGYELPGGKTIAEIIRDANPDDFFMLHLDGGRGSDSDSWTGSFGHANDGPGNRTDKQDFPARMNTKVKQKNVDEALRQFNLTHANDDKESAVTVDENGFITQYVHGMEHSVMIGGRKGEMVYHNHPNGSNFSDADLISTATGAAKGIVASGKNGFYSFQKGQHFKAAEFVKAVRNAKLKGKDYNDAVHKWLTRNKKKYGYVYSRVKA